MGDIEPIRLKEGNRANEIELFEKLTEKNATKLARWEKNEFFHRFGGLIELFNTRVSVSVDEYVLLTLFLTLSSAKLVFNSKTTKFRLL